MGKRKTTTEPAETPTDPATRSEYTVLARRYRPQQFTDLVGQEPVAQVLKNAIESHRVAHAYLFTGARGVGKTSTARILAKCLNCIKGPTITPCDECDMCRAIAVGEDIDVLEIDGASNNGVDQVRELRQNVNLRPSRSRYKIYIIDEVHMLSTAAFNALLKTLEEPPTHVKFIFATTEVQKIPVTILSRCQRFDFAGIGIPRIVARLREIVSGEKMEADDEALQLIARRAAGSMRDAQSLLDQLLSFGGDKLTAERVHRLLGTANEERISALATALLEKNGPKALELLGQTVDEGLQLGELLDQLIDYWRDMMVVQCTGVESQALSVVGAARQLLKQQASQMRPDTILAGLDILVTAKARMKMSILGRVLMEMAFVRLTRLEDLVSLAQLAQWASSREGPPASAPRPAPKPAAASVGERRAAETPVKPHQEPTPVAAEEKKKELAAAPSPSESGPLTQEHVRDLWSQVESESGLAIRSDLQKAEVAISGPNSLVLRFPSEYNHALDSSRLARLQEVVCRFFGPEVTLRVETVNATGPLGKSPAGSGSPAVAPAPVSQPPAESAAVRGKRAQAELVKVPLVKKAMEVLGAQIIQQDEDFARSAPANPPAETEAREEPAEE